MSSEKQEFTDSAIRDIIKDNLERIVDDKNRHMYFDMIQSNCYTGDTIELSHDIFDPNVQEILRTIESNKRHSVIRDAVELSFAEINGIEKLEVVKKENLININWDGQKLETISEDQEFEDYQKTVPSNMMQGTTWMVSYLIRRRHMISKFDIYNFLDKWLKQLVSGLKPNDKFLPILIAFGKKDYGKIIDEMFKTPEITVYTTKIAEIMGKNNEKIQFHKSQIQEIGSYIFGKLHVKRIMFDNTLSDVLLISNGRMFVNEVGKGDMIKREVSEITYDHNITIRNEVFEYVKTIAKITDNKDVENTFHIICLKNGYYNTKTYEFSTTYDPELLITQELPITYNPKARCPNFIRYVNNAIVEPIQRLGFWEFFSWILVFDLKLNKAAFFVGESAQNGKSTLIDYILDYFGLHNCASVSLYKLVSDKYASSDLYMKRLNAYAETSSERIEYLDEFRALVTRDRIRAEHKYQHAFFFRPFAINIFSVNLLPELGQHGDNTYRRLYPFNFVNKFKENPTPEELRKGVQRIDLQLLKDMNTDEEKSGIFNMLINISKKLRKNQRFSYAPTEEQVRGYWENTSNHLRDFSNKFLKPVLGAYITNHEMHKRYKFEYAANRKVITPYGYNEFVKLFADNCEFPTYSDKVTSGINNNEFRNKHCWHNVWWSDKPLPDYIVDRMKAIDKKDDNTQKTLDQKTSNLTE